MRRERLPVVDDAVRGLLDVVEGQDDLLRRPTFATFYETDGLVIE